MCCFRNVEDKIELWMLKKPDCLCCKEYNSNNLEDSFTCFENGIFYEQKMWKKAILSNWSDFSLTNISDIVKKE